MGVGGVTDGSEMFIWGWSVGGVIDRRKHVSLLCIKSVAEENAFLFGHCVYSVTGVPKIVLMSHKSWVLSQNRVNKYM